MDRYTHFHMPSSITRRRFGSVLAGGLGLGAAAPAQTRPPNILFLVADELRGDSVGFMGHPVVKTPNLDRLARGGVALRNCFTPSPASVPARVSALTGRYPRTHGVTADDAPLREDEVLLPQLLARKGYRTGLVGELSLPGRNVEDLFDSHETFAAEYQAFLSEHYPQLEGDPDAVGNKFEGAGEIPWNTGATRLPALSCPAAWAAEKTLELAKAGAADEPWFLFTGFRKAEDTFVSPYPWPTRYPLDQVSVPVLPNERPTPATREDRDADYVTAGYEATLARVRRAYFGGISYLDEQVGAIVRGLRDLGQLENTLIVFTSDHGNMMGELGRMGSRTPYDGATHVPCIFHYEAGFEITGGVDRVTDTTCLAPTILDLAGLGEPEGFESPSAKEILTVVGADWDEVAFSESGFRTVRTPQWKLVEPGDHPNWEPQLFDLENDPRERTNVYGTPGAADAQRKLAARLQEWDAARPGPLQV